jgi:hypothetical protein
MEPGLAGWTANAPGLDAPASLLARADEGVVAPPGFDFRKGQHFAVAQSTVAKYMAGADGRPSGQSWGAPRCTSGENRESRGYATTRKRSMGKIKFEGNPPYALPIAQNVTARAEGVIVEMTVDVIAPGKEPSIVPIKVQMTLDSARSLRAQLQPAITMAEVHQRR